MHSTNSVKYYNNQSSKNKNKIILKLSNFRVLIFYLFFTASSIKKIGKSSDAETLNFNNQRKLMKI